MLFSMMMNELRPEGVARHGYTEVSMVREAAVICSVSGASSSPKWVHLPTMNGDFLLSSERICD